MILQCPSCHARNSVEAFLENAAAREVMGILSSRQVNLSRPLATYLGLFRSKRRALGWDRAERLAREVLALEKNEDLLAGALRETVEKIFAKREHEPPRPLTNHNYLKRVLESFRGSQPAPAPEPTAPELPPEEPPDPEAQRRVRDLTAGILKDAGGGRRP